MANNPLLLRQVHPNFIVTGRVTSQAFRPTPEHEMKLSAYNGDQISAVNAWSHYTSVLGRPSAGVLGISRSECEELGLPTRPDPLPNFPDHVIIDFNNLSNNTVILYSQLLRNRALARGWLFQAA